MGVCGGGGGGGGRGGGRGRGRGGGGRQSRGANLRTSLIGRTAFIPLTQDESRRETSSTAHIRIAVETNRCQSGSQPTEFVLSLATLPVILPGLCTDSRYQAEGFCVLLPLLPLCVLTCLIVARHSGLSIFVTGVGFIVVMFLFFTRCAG